MNVRLREFEAFLTRGSIETAKILGVSTSNYYSLRSGDRDLPPYIETHIDTLQRVDAQTLNEIVKDRLTHA